MSFKRRLRYTYGALDGMYAVKHSSKTNNKF
jgi:hypothetical protein